MPCLAIVAMHGDAPLTVLYMANFGLHKKRRRYEGQPWSHQDALHYVRDGGSPARESKKFI